MANIDNVQLPDGSSYNIVDNTSGFATQNYVDSAVDSVTKTTIGLGNVDNTSDLNKPISMATQAALDTLDEDKADKTDIATIESGTTASRAYSVGELVYVSGTLYRVKTAIASGATFTVGTNIEAKNVSDVISESREWNVLGIYNDNATYTLTIPDNYTELNVLVYQNSSGTWRVVSINIPLLLVEPMTQSAYYYGGGYIASNSFTTAQVQFNAPNKSIKLVQLVINGTVQTNFAMKVLGR